MSDEDTIKINVKDDIASGDGSGSTPKDADLRELAMKYLSRYVAPHITVSREVKEEDLQRVTEEGEIMYNLCMIPRGRATGAEAIAHMQIDDKDPLAFFVTKSGEFIVNPKIVRTTNAYIDSEEGCVSFPGELDKKVQRFHKVEAIFSTLLPGEGENAKPTLSPPMRIGLSGRGAKVFQHECSHINGWNIYDEDFVPEACKWSRTELDKNLQDK